MNIFSVWWIGKARKDFPQFSVGQVIGIYMGLVLGYGVMLLISGLTAPFISVRNTEALADDIIKPYERAHPGWVEKTVKIFLVVCCIGRVFFP